MRVAGYNNLQNINYNKNNANKSTNFKALIMDPSIKLQLAPKYKETVQLLQTYRAHMDSFRFWDLKVLSKNTEPLFILKSKKHKNEYLLPPVDIEAPILMDKEGMTIVPCAVFSRIKDCEDYEEKVVSNYDSFLAHHNHLLCLTYSSKEKAKEKFDKIKNYRDRQAFVFENNLKAYPLAYGLTDYIMFLLDEFEEVSVKNSSKLPKGKPDECEDTERVEEAEEVKSFLVRKADPEIINGTKSVSSNGEKKGFAKVAGMNDLKEILKEDVILPLQQVELYKKYGIEPANGILLYGPPGTGKTFIAEALAEESGRSFFKMKISDTESKYVGETSKNIANVFKEAEEKAPSIIFIDEIEGLIPSRSSLDTSSSASVGHNQAVNTLLENMNNCSERGIFVITATNEPQKVDSALKRPGRIDKNIFVGPPDFEARKELFRLQLDDIYSEKNIDYDKLASLTENYTAMEIKRMIVRQAALSALKQNRRISEADIVSQIENYTPQLTPQMIEEYRKKGEINKNKNSSATKIGYIK